jgi:ABC-type glycerol-3-phosphate transport system substrate-binding protein
MTRHRVPLFGLLLALLLLVAAACGGGEEGGGGATGTQAANVSGSVTLLADWTGPEGQSIQAVMDAFKAKYPNVDAKYRPSTNIGQDLSTAIEGGNPPDLAAVPNPGLTADYQSRGVLKPIEFARSTVEDNFSQDWVDLGTIDGKLYGVFFKGANKSTVWYNVHAFDDAGVQPPETWDDLMTDTQTIKASGVPAWSFGAADGWTLTDLFENIYARQSGPDKYRQLTTHDIPWTDASVKQALQTMADIFKDGDNIAGGIDGALQTDFPTSVSNVFANPPKAAIIAEGDFVPGVVAGQTPAKPQTDYDFFDFPTIGDTGSVVVGGGNEVIMFNDTPASRALVEFLASPEAGEVWAKRGGFSSPNKNVSADVYPDDITRRSATALASAENFLFDMSDLAPAEFGSDAEFSILQDFFKNQDVDGTAQKLEDAAAKAYK